MPEVPGASSRRPPKAILDRLSLLKSGERGQRVTPVQKPRRPFPKPISTQRQKLAPSKEVIQEKRVRPFEKVRQKKSWADSGSGRCHIGVVCYRAGSRACIHAGAPPPADAVVHDEYPPREA